MENDEAKRLLESLESAETELVDALFVNDRSVLKEMLRLMGYRYDEKIEGILKVAYRMGAKAGQGSFAMVLKREMDAEQAKRKAAKPAEGEAK